MGIKKNSSKITGTITDLKKFMMRGNVVDLAVGVVIGGAFGKIVTSLVNDIIMPPLGFILNGVNFKELSFVLKEATTSASGEVLPAVTINYGAFIQTMFDFIIIASAIFFFIKLLNSMQREKDEAAEVTPPAPSKEEELLTEIRDLLKKESQKN